MIIIPLEGEGESLADICKASECSQGKENARPKWVLHPPLYDNQRFFAYGRCHKRKLATPEHLQKRLPGCIGQGRDQRHGGSRRSASGTGLDTGPIPMVLSVSVASYCVVRLQGVQRELGSHMKEPMQKGDL